MKDLLIIFAFMLLIIQCYRIYKLETDNKPDMILEGAVGGVAFANVIFILSCS